ncbi:MAG: hypothetical protein JO286_03190 [Solirubrobacterales bacterium]|nr:hypothetical protein [Solirubrobacterales bacterium]MBV9362707.1 hypothetical protein [Solirubrobacterales bacterium]MBV9684711.1 hypothetical protein [Solirubrobacterales bacterium]MBV9806158.1 hypothetical protein [Solirubrobacterales bacterium]
MKLLATIVVLLVGAAPGSTPIGRQSVALDRACHATMAAVRQAMTGAAARQQRAISSHLQVVVPGIVTGEIAFNASGWSISVGAPQTQGSSFGCGEATARHGGGAGQSHVVTTLSDRFTRSGDYTLTFTLNATGRRILARLGAEERAYYRRHPHGSEPPTIAFGVGLSYAPAS